MALGLKVVGTARAWVRKASSAEHMASGADGTHETVVILIYDQKLCHQSSL